MLFSYCVYRFHSLALFLRRENSVIHSRHVFRYLAVIGTVDTVHSKCNIKLELGIESLIGGGSGCHIVAL